MSWWFGYAAGLSGVLFAYLVWALWAESRREEREYEAWRNGGPPREWPRTPTTSDVMRHRNGQ